MIRTKQLSDEEWLVTVTATTTTQHRVRLTAEDLKRFAGGESAKADPLLQASFRFLLERESNTSILEEFDLPVIARYFPEYESEIGKYIRS